MSDYSDYDQGEPEGVSGRSILTFTASLLTSALIFLEFSPYKDTSVLETETQVVEGVEVVMTAANFSVPLTNQVRDKIADFIPAIEKSAPLPPLENPDFVRAAAVLKMVALYQGLDLGEDEYFVESWLSRKPHTLQGEVRGIDGGPVRVVAHEGADIDLRQIGVVGFKDEGVSRAVLDDQILLASADGSLVRVDSKGNPLTIITNDAFRGGQGWIGNRFGYGEELAWIYMPMSGEVGMPLVGSLNAKTWFWIGGRVQRLGPKSAQWYPESEPVELQRPDRVPETGSWARLIKGAVAHEPVGMLDSHVMVFRASGPGEIYGLWSLNVLTGSVTLLETWSTARPLLASQ